MSKRGKYFLAAGAVATLCGLFGASDSFAATKQFTVQTNYELSSSESVDLTFELQNIDGSVVSSKTSGPGLISFDPIELDDADNTSHYYKIVQKNTGIPGVSYDNKIVYVRIVASRDILAYQDDATYKYVNDGTGPHPYHATEEELQGQAYAVYDSKTKTLTFFRDEEGKYTDGYAERIMDGDETQYKQYFTGFELANKDHPDGYGAARPSWSYGCQKYVQFDNPYYFHECTVAEDTEKIIFKDAIRPEGAMLEWFHIFKNVTSADIAKLDTSRATSMAYFFDQAPKLTDIDLTHLDFRNISETFANGETSAPWRDFFASSSSAVPEFDFTNYDLADMIIPSGRPAMGSSTLLDAGLRYLNTTNLSSESGSAEFNNNPCLERLVVGEKFSFYRSNIDAEIDPSGHKTYSEKSWLKIETGEIGSAMSIISYDHGTYVGDPNPLAAGNYVRPTCNVTPATFTANYTKPAIVPDEEEAKEEIVNPATNDDLLKHILVGLGAAAILALAFSARVKNAL